MCSLLVVFEDTDESEAELEILLFGLDIKQKEDCGISSVFSDAFPDLEVV
jgi:hypothetical protein